MKARSTPPVAATLLEAMRAIGYSFESAIADLIDNSVAADAGKIKIAFSPFGDPHVVLLDDGLGMSPETLMVAMRHGSRNPLDTRGAKDLGRFGLGLKTASLSQCRRLTVVSKHAGVISGAEWDLDEVARRDDWSLMELEGDDFKTVPAISELLAREHGTLVVWRALDRALAGESDIERALQDHIDRTRDHLALVFHRYLEGNSPDLTITINGLSVVPQDPFLRTRKGRQTLPTEPLDIDGQLVTVEAHILPHVSKLSAPEIEEAGGEDGLRRNQGFYVYRNRRLIIWGTWFRLAKQEEMTKLARVQVDIPNTLDHLWSLDIKKSMAHPPDKVRQGLRQIVERIADRSRQVYRYRGTVTTTSDIVPGWNRIEVRGGKFRYLVNREHDLFHAMRLALSESDALLLERFAQMVEESFPYDAAYADMASDKQPASAEPGDVLMDRLRDTARLLLSALDGQPDARTALLGRLHLLEPFCRHTEITRKLQESLS